MPHHYAPTAEIITIGDEILYGQITDTNSQWLSAELDAIGIRTVRKSSVNDQKESILGIIHEAKKRASVIIFTGGLGPTKDDITKQTLAEYYNVELTFRQEVMADIEALFKKRNRSLNNLHNTQAMIPANAQVLNNYLGTAPGMFFQEPYHLIFSLPGVPYEMKGIFTNKIVPILKANIELPVVLHKYVKTVGIPESQIALKLQEWELGLPSHIKLAYLPSAGQVKLRITGTGIEQYQLTQQLNMQAAQAATLLGDYVYALEDIPLEQHLISTLHEQGLTIAIAESCTGGHIAAAITKIDGASLVLKGGVVAYTNTVKEQLLGVDSKLIEQHTAVNQEVSAQMAAGVAHLLSADIGLSSTGVAGATSPYPGVLPGTVFVSVWYKGKAHTEQITLPFQRSLNIEMATTFALNLVRKTLLQS
jgi:nicotinamide-nucleotide amidase